MAIDLEARFTAGQEIIREAGALALKHFRARDALDVSQKGRQDLVSNADKEVEQLIRTRIAAAFPGDTVMGEEEGLIGDVSEDGLWVVDPIDGTAPFLAGMGTWCISLAFARPGAADGDIPIGLIYVPCMGELYAAMAGHGGTLNGNPLKPHPATALSDGLFGVGFSTRCQPDHVVPIFKGLFEAGGIHHCNGSGALMVAYVAAGALIGYYEPHINSWDCLAGIALVRESGGWTNDFLADNGLHTGKALLATAPGVTAAGRALTGI